MRDLSKRELLMRGQSKRVIDEGPVEERVIDKGPVEERVVDEGPVEERVIDEGPVEEPVIDEGPVEEKVIDEGPVEEKVIDEGPVEEVLAVVQARPFEEKVVEKRPDEERVVEERVVHERPVEERLFEDKPSKVQRIECYESKRKRCMERSSIDGLRNRGKVDVRTDLDDSSCDEYCFLSEKKRVVATSYLLLPAPTGASAALSGVLASSQRDDISRILKSDRFILQLGEQLVSGIGNAKDSESNIRGYLRRMARLLQVMRIQESSPNARLKSFLTPSKYRVCLTAAKSLAGYDENKSQYDTPSLALKVGHTLKKCATILEGQRLEKQDNDGASDAVSFRRLLELNCHSHNTPLVSKFGSGLADILQRAQWVSLYGKRIKLQFANHDF
ncbi:hypothetical protein CAPTEDRAFT_194066 [Capitella teleta]|uniref:Uncharacterized protein n=1 Tax=Capitella teleta TaxID=283909 RepID=R7VAS0_CAPTE|nr:hypothetical protein CAPTEDRAFT_194066 [Capitella teleta]|eukprot:ELU12800.1 hypothetical protein CAPTEDRAFT_194066 [Capitella teleta]